MKRLLFALCAGAAILSALAANPSAPAANPSAGAAPSPTATKAYVDRQIAAAAQAASNNTAAAIAAIPQPEPPDLSAYATKEDLDAKVDNDLFTTLADEWIQYDINNDVGKIPAAIAAATNGLATTAALAQKADRSDLAPLVDGDRLNQTVDNIRGEAATLYATKSALEGKADASALAGKADASTVAALGADVAAWTTYWDGDDVRLTVTNYYGSLDMPRLYLEQKIEGTDNYRVVWDELTRQTNLSARIDAIAADLALDAIPLRAWGHFDSHTGNAAPDGFASVSASNIIIAAGMAYQKFITSSGAAWVLTANEPFTLTGNADTDAGGFKITDGDGSALFEIVKGDKRTVGANAAGITVNGNTITIPFAVAAGTHPALQISRSLRPSEWVDESDASSFCTVTWSGGSGNWVATVTARQPEPQMFFRATYEIGGETYIKNNVSHSADKLTINGVQYRVAVETLTINGQQKKVMVLNEL